MTKLENVAKERKHNSMTSKSGYDWEYEELKKLVAEDKRGINVDLEVEIRELIASAIKYRYPYLDAIWKKLSGL